MRHLLNITSVFCVVMMIWSCNSDNSSPQQQEHKAYHNPAVESYTNAIAEDSDNASLYYKRSLALFNINMDELALKDMERAVALEPQNDIFWAAKGELYTYLEKYSKAVLAFKKAYELNPKKEIYNVAIGQSLLMDNKIEQSKAIANQIVANSPDYPDGYYLQARVAAAQKDSLKAESLYKKALSIDPSYYEASLQLAELYALQKNDIAVTQYQYTFEIEPSDVYPLFQIGYYYEGINQTEKAKQAYINCINHNRDYTDAYIQIGRILIQQDSVEKAKRNFIIAVGTEPSNSKAHYLLGLSYEKLQIMDSAKFQYANALTLNPNNQEAQEAVERFRNTKK